MKKNIALVAGGYSGESVISIQSAAVIARNIDPAAYDVYTIIIARDAWYYTDNNGIAIPVDKNDFSLQVDGRKVKFDAVFIGIHGTPGEDGRLQGYLDMLQIPYTSCNAITSALTFNKSYCNKVVNAFGVVKISRSVHLFKEQPYDVDAILQKLVLPCFVKPNEGGSSIGMSKVKTAEELPSAIKKAFREDDQVLIEEYIRGREFTCGLFKARGKMTVLPVTEIVSSKEFFDYEAKYTPGKSDEITPAPIPAALSERIQSAAANIYCQLNCKGIARIDFILQEGTEDLYFLEINTMPGQSENSIVPKQVRAAGLTLQAFYGMLLEEV